MLNVLKSRLTKYNTEKIFNLLKNSGWIFFDKIFRIATGLFVGIWIARYLGPDKYGLLSYVTAFPQFLTALSGLGLTNLLYNEFIIHSNVLTIKRIFSTSVLVKLISGALCLGLAVIASYIIDKDKYIVTLVTISSISLIAQSSDVVDTFFQSQRKVQYSIIPKLVILGFSTILRVIALQGKYDIIYFVLINTFEQIANAILSLIVYIRFVDFKILNFRIYSLIGIDLIKRAWPLMISEFFLSFYVRIDLLMIKHLSTNIDLGNYSVALRLTDFWYFIPMAMTASLYPSIVTFRQSDYKQYLTRYKYMLRAFVLISISIGIFITLASSSLVHLLYGDKYRGVAEILAINVWTGLFVFLDIGASNWFIVENLQRFVLKRTVIGALMNVSLNFILIPIFGAVGASIATLITQISVSYLVNGLYTRTKEIFTLQTNALLFLPKLAWTIMRKRFY